MSRRGDRGAKDAPQHLGAHEPRHLGVRRRGGALSRPPRRRILLFAAAVLVVLVIAAAASLLLTGSPSGKDTRPTGTTAPKVEVPDLTGKAISEAEAILKKAGLHASATTRFSREPTGKILSQFPAARTLIEQDDFVELTVSGGPRPKQPKTTTTNAPTTTLPAVKTSSGKYSGYVVVLDAGHQLHGDSSTEPIGPGSKTKKAKVSQGATGVLTRVPEYKLTLALARRIEAKLKAKDVWVVMTRSTHDVNLSNIERAKIGNKSRANLVVRLHADGNPDSSVKGVSTLFPGDNKWTGPIRARSRQAAEFIQAELVRFTRRTDRGLSARTDITGFNWSTVPVVLPEVGFLSNPNEDKLLNTTEEQERIATGIVAGILKFLGTQPKPK